MSLSRFAALVGALFMVACQQLITVAEATWLMPEAPPESEGAPPSAPEDPNVVALSKEDVTHWVDISIDGITTTYLGDEYAECTRSRADVTAAFELELQIQDADDLGFQMTYAGFMGPHKFDYPLVAKTYEDTIGGLGTEGQPRTRVVELPGRRLEASLVDLGFRERQSTCRDRFTLSADGVLTGTLSCERLYDDRDQPSSVVISFRCPMSDIGGAL